MTEAGPIRIRFWGVRGSYPVPGASTVEVGGNTSCVEVEVAGQTVVFDAGTGVIPLGQDLVTREHSRVIHCFLSHMHHDHVEGFRFFEPAYTEGWHCWVYGVGRGRDGLGRVLGSLMKPPLFPLALRDLAAQVSVRTLPSGSKVVLDPSKPSVLSSRAAAPEDRPVVASRQCRTHPKSGVTLFRLSFSGRSIVYATDVEGVKSAFSDIVTFAKGADILIHDAQYLSEEYDNSEAGKAGWGHSTVNMAAEIAKEARVSELILFHHAPERSDAEVARLERVARSLFPTARAAREGMEILLH